MNADEIVAYFVNEVAPVYNSLQDKGKKIYYAILQSLPPDHFEEVASKLSCESHIPWDLMGFIDWMRKERPKKTEQPNEPITTLLRWYQDKGSKKVSYAYERLVKRFDAQSFTDQKKIIGAFLTGGKKSSEWAATRLRRNWIPGFENEIEAAWNEYRGPSMALTIMHMMPEEFVIKEQNELVEAACLPDAYAILCGRLGRTPGFTIDESRLSILDWFYVVGKLGLSEKIPEINGKFNQYILNLNADDYVGYKNTEGYSLVYILGMSRIIWAMKQLNYTDGLIWLERLERRAVNHSKEFETSKTWASSALEYLKSLLGRKNIKLHSDN
jgi:hypothetical protein